MPPLRILDQAGKNDESEGAGGPMVSAAQLAGGAAWSVAGRAFQFAVGLAALAVVARWVGPEAYGVFALSAVMVGLLEIAVSVAPIDTLVQRRELRPGHCNASFLSALAIALCALGLVAAGAPMLTSWFAGGEMLAGILPVRAAVLVASAAAAVPTALLMRAGRFKALAAVGATAGLLASVTGIAAAIAGAGVWSLVAMEAVRQLVSALLVFRLSSWRPGLRFARADVRELIAFNAAGWAAWCTSYAESQVPRILIASSLGTQALGFFALAQGIFAQVSGVLVVPAYQALLPGLSRVQADRESARRLAESVLRGAAVVAAPAFLGLAAVSGLLVPLVLGEQWAEVVPVVQLLMLLGLRSSLSTVQIAVVRGMGRAGLHLAAEVLGMAMTVAASVATVSLGLLPLTAALAVKGFLMGVPYAWLVRNLTGLTLGRQLRAVVGPAMAASSMAIVVMAFVTWTRTSLPAVAALAAAVLLGTGAYVALLSVFAPDAGRFVRAVLGAVLRGNLKEVRRMFAG